MNRLSNFLPALGTAMLVAAGLVHPAEAQTYKIDDGTPGYALSYAYPEDLCWLNVLQVNGTTTLTSIEAILGDAPDGTPVTLCVWRDLGQFGQPWEGLLLTQVHTVVQNSGKQLLTQYPIPPTTVSGTFFVGAFLTVDGSMSPATLDPHTPNLKRSWFATAYGPGTFDPDYLGVWTWYSPVTLGIQGVFMLRANGPDGPTPDVRCVAKVNSLGCLPTLDFSGASSAGAGGGFTISAAQVLNNTNGLLIYSTAGLQQLPFGGGWLCLNSPVHRTPLQLSGGSPVGSDCSGHFAFDFNAYIATGLDTALVPGATVDAQFWSRDTGFVAPSNIGLTAAAHFGIGP